MNDKKDKNPMEYCIAAGRYDHPGFTKDYKRFKLAMNYFDKLIEVAEHSIKCDVKDYKRIEFYVNDNLVISWNEGKFKWHNRCPKCGDFATERTLRFCCT